MTLAGQPTAIQFFGIFFVTTLPAPLSFNEYFLYLQLWYFLQYSHLHFKNFSFFNFFTYTIVVFPPLYC